MKRKLGIILILTLAFGAIIFFTTSTPRQPNIILIVIDALRADHLGCYGADPSPSPFIDSLAQKSIFFEQAYSQSSCTYASTISIITGKYPREVIRDFHDHVPDNTSTIAQHLNDRGYQTEAHITNVNLNYGAFKDFDQEHQYIIRLREKSPYNRYRYGSTRDILDNLQPLPEPYFRYIHLMEVHGAWRPDQVEELLPRDLRAETQNLLKSLEKFSEENALEYPHIYRAFYDGSISYIDREIQRFVRTLDDDTILIITADHGQAIFDRGPYCDHGHGLYSEDVRVPLLIYRKGIEPQVITKPFEIRNLGQYLLHDRIITGAAYTEAFVIPFTIGRALYTEDSHYIEYEKYRDQEVHFSVGDTSLKDQFPTITDASPENQKHPPLTQEKIDQLKSFGYLR